MSVKKQASQKTMPIKKQVMLSLGVFGVFLGLSVLFMMNSPNVPRRSVKPPSLTIETMDIKSEPFQVKIDSYGVVEPRTQTALFPQVSGQVVEVSENFREGGFFEKGDVLLRIDDRDYQALLTITASELQTAIQNLEEEKARVKQALDDWKRLGKSTQAPQLVLRKPQLAASRAQVEAAQAKLGQAELNLQRTSLVAPYAGRVLSKQVDLGQLVSPATTVGEIYAIDYVEIRLPLTNKALKFIDLPETFRDHTVKGSQPPVRFQSELGEGDQFWRGRVVRTEGAIDRMTNQLYVIAQIDDPYQITPNTKLALKIGQYVEAKIVGKLLENAIVIPAKAVYQGRYVYLYKDGVINRQDISIAWRNNDKLVIDKGIQTGDQLVLTTMGQVISGTAVQLKGQGSVRGIKRSPRQARKNPQ